MDNQYDVVVMGAGNAGLSAAIAAADEGARVLILEAAPKHAMGGNSYFAGGVFRFPYGGIEEIRQLMPDLSPSEEEKLVLQPYTADDFYEDIMSLSDFQSDPELVGLLVDEAFDTMIWLSRHGIRFNIQFGRQGFKDEDGRVHFPGGVILGAVGGGKGLIETEVRTAEKLGIDFRYETMGTALTTEKGSVTGIVVSNQGKLETISAKGVILASGGFEANPEMRAKYLGPGWDRTKVRGTQYNMGKGIIMALEVGALPFGNWSGAHAVAWDANAPDFGDRQLANLYSKHSYPLGIVVNKDGLRFLDEGYDFHARTYARYGGEILKQRSRLAFQIFDQKVIHLLREEYRIAQVTKAEARTIEDLAEALEIDKEGLSKTVAEFNEAVDESVAFDPTRKDGKATKGISPRKSNWAQRIDTPPFVGFAVTCGITYTFGGLRVDTSGRILGFDARPIPGLFGAGELIGGIFYGNYPSGSGLTLGATFGRIAGKSAVGH